MNVTIEILGSVGALVNMRTRGGKIEADVRWAGRARTQKRLLFTPEQWGRAILRPSSDGKLHVTTKNSLPLGFANFVEV